MTDVRIRHVDDAFGVSLGDVPFGELEGVIPMLKRWGLYIGEDFETDLSAQFTIDEDAIYFEVLAGEDE